MANIPWNRLSTGNIYLGEEIGYEGSFGKFCNRDLVKKKNTIPFASIFIISWLLVHFNSLREFVKGDPDILDDDVIVMELSEWGMSAW